MSYIEAFSEPIPVRLMLADTFAGGSTTVPTGEAVVTMWSGVVFSTDPTGGAYLRHGDTTVAAVFSPAGQPFQQFSIELWLVCASGDNLTVITDATVDCSSEISGWSRQTSALA